MFRDAHDGSANYLRGRDRNTDDGFNMPAKVRKAVFPAAGLGTRFLPATKVMPKEMLPMVDKPIIQYGVEEVLRSGIDNVIIVTGRGKSALEDHFDYSFELESLLESREENRTSEYLAGRVGDGQHLVHSAEAGAGTWTCGAARERACR